MHFANVFKRMTFPFVKRANTKNTQIQSAKKTQPVEYFWKNGLFKDMKNDIPVCQMHKYKKYKYTSTGYDEVSERPSMWYVFEKRFSRLSDVSDLTNFCTQVFDIKW